MNNPLILPEPEFTPFDDDGLDALEEEEDDCYLFSNVNQKKAN